MNAKEILIYMTETLLFYLDELSAYVDDKVNQFVYGEKTAYTECLAMIQLWEEAQEHGLNFEIESKFPLFIE